MGNIRKEMKILRKNKKKKRWGSKPAVKIKNAPGGVISSLAEQWRLEDVKRETSKWKNEDTRKEGSKHHGITLKGVLTCQGIIKRGEGTIETYLKQGPTVSPN